MKNILFLILLGPFLFSQNFQMKDSLKVLAMSNFKTMELFINKNGRLNPVRHYSYDQNKNEMTIKNVSEKNKNWIKTIVRFDDVYNIKEAEKIIDGIMISEKENKLVNKQFSMLQKFNYTENTIQIDSFDSENKLYKKVFQIFNDKKSLVESLILLRVPNDIVVAEIERYNWIDDKSYNYEKQNFTFPRTKIIGVYKLNSYNEIQSFKGSMTINDNTELYDYYINTKLKQFDTKGNIIKIYTLENGQEDILEERKIVY